jgi:hypothetical protein
MPRAAKAVIAAPQTKTKTKPLIERKRTPVRRKAPAAFDPTAHREEIAHAAYLNWLARGGEAENPEEDWLIAEQSVRAKYVN